MSRSCLGQQVSIGVLVGVCGPDIVDLEEVADNTLVSLLCMLYSPRTFRAGTCEQTKLIRVEIQRTWD